MQNKTGLMDGVSFGSYKEWWFLFAVSGEFFQNSSFFFFFSEEVSLEWIVPSCLFSYLLHSLIFAITFLHTLSISIALCFSVLSLGCFFCLAFLFFPLFFKKRGGGGHTREFYVLPFFSSFHPLES